MNDSKISVRYAKALFESAAEKGILDEVRKDMLHLQDVCTLKEFDRFLHTPVMKGSEKCKLINKGLEGRIQPLSMSLLELVLKNNRELYLPGIARNFEDQYKKHKGIKSAVLVSATALDKPAKDKLLEVLKEALDSRIELTTERDKDLIGGFVIRIEDQQYDASVANKLKKIEKELLN